MEQKIALVTGANKGIGYEVAAQLVAKNFHVFVGARNEKAGREAAMDAVAERRADRYARHEPLAVPRRHEVLQGIREDPVRADLPVPLSEVR